MASEEFGVEFGENASFGVDCRLHRCVLEGRIGDRCVVWRFAHIMDGAHLGDDCMVAQNVFIADNVRIGSRVRIQNNAGIGRGAVIGDDVYIGPNVMFANARHPSVNRSDGKVIEPITVEDGASIGANAVILGGVTIGRGAVVAAGAVVLRSVPAGCMVAGQPARIKRAPFRDLPGSYQAFEDDRDGDDG